MGGPCAVLSRSGAGGRDERIFRRQTRGGRRPKGRAKSAGRGRPLVRMDGEVRGRPPMSSRVVPPAAKVIR